MPLISCSECGNQVSDKAATCPKCGNPIAGPPTTARRKTSPVAWGCLIFIVVPVFFVAIFASLATNQYDAYKRTAAEKAPAAAAKPQEPDRSRCDGIDYEELRKGFIHRTTDGGRHVYVTSAWYGLTLERKQAIGQYLAHCQSATGWTEIHDAQTGKKLGKGSRSWGYSNYEG